jgi:hypothetical protein
MKSLEAPQKCSLQFHAQASSENLGLLMETDFDFGAQTDPWRTSRQKAARRPVEGKRRMKESFDENAVHLFHSGTKH